MCTEWLWHPAGFELPRHMATSRQGTGDDSPNKGSSITSPSQAQPSNIPLFGKYHQLHDEYSALLDDISAKVIFTPEDHDKVERSAEIEYQACGVARAQKNGLCGRFNWKESMGFDPLHAFYFGFKQEKNL